MTTTQTIEKVIPSPLERGLENISYSLVPLVPLAVKPNHITWIGFGASAFAALSFYLASFNHIWLLVAVVAIVAHLILDALDGAVARQRNQTSKAGFFLDLFLDCLAFVLIPVGIYFSSFAPLNIVAANAITYPLHSMLLLHWVHLRNKWIFPIIGPCEAHLGYIAMAILTFFWKGDVLTVWHYTFDWFDLIALVVTPLVLLEIFISAFKLLKELEASQ